MDGRAAILGRVEPATEIVASDEQDRGHGHRCRLADGRDEDPAEQRTDDRADGLAQARHDVGRDELVGQPGQGWEQGGLDGPDHDAGGCDDRRPDEHHRRRSAQPDSDSAPDRPERSQDVGRHQHAPAAEPGSWHAGERPGQRRRQHPDEAEDAHAQRAAGLIGDDQESDEQDPVAGDPARVGGLDAPDRGVGDRRPERASGSPNGRAHGSRVEYGEARRAAADPADLLDRRELLVVLGADRAKDLLVDVELVGDLVDRPGLLRGDRAVGRHHREAGADDRDPLGVVGERLELAGHDVVLGAADGLRLELGHLGHQDGGRLVDRLAGPGARARWRRSPRR